jgi:hypothetical protein
MPHLDGLKLGELIDKLEKCYPECEVYFDFGDLRCGALGSYRGFYEDLALGFAENKNHPATETAGALLSSLRGAIGASFIGYKGGDFRMTRDSAVWVANYGNTTSTVIADVREDLWADGDGGRVTLLTKYVPH